MTTSEQIARGQAQGRENAIVNVALTPLEQPKFTNLKLQRDIILNDFIFNTIDDFNVVWVITDIEGWWEPPPADVPDIPRGWGDGSYDVQGRYEARSLVLKGSFLTPNPSLAQDARDRLMSAINLVYRGAWLLTGSDPIRASWVRLADGPTFTNVNARGRTDFEIPLRAPDPIKYSWNDAQPDGYEYEEFGALNYNSAGSGTGVIENIGNYNVPCILEVSGPIVGPATLYNRTTDQLIIITSSFGGSLSARVENKQLSFNSSTLEDVATLTTRQPHGFTVGSNIYVSGVGDPFDGNYTIKSVPTETTLTYVRLPEVAVIKQVAYRSLQSNVATLETTTNHSFSIGDEVVVSGVDSVFNGTYPITGVDGSTKFSYQASRVPVASVIGRILVSNVATLTTSAPHGFLPGEQVTVTGIDSTNFNGTFIISSVSSDGLQFSYPRNRTDSRVVTNSSLTNQIATITTSAPHGFVVGEQVAVSNVSSAYDGTYDIINTPTSTTFTYKRIRSTRANVVAKAASGGIATLTTSSPHGIFAGDRVVVEDVDATFNGTYTVISTPSSTAIAYAKSGTIAPTPVVAGSATPSGRWIIRKSLIGNVATLTTLASHGIFVGESVTVSGVGAPFDGTFVVTETTSNTFSYTRTGANVSDIPTALTVSFITRGGAQQAGTTATITTAGTHGFSNGDQVFIGGISDPSFNGFYTITVPSANTIRYTTAISGTVLANDGGPIEAGEGAYVVKGKVVYSGGIASTLVIDGNADVSGSLPFASTSGTATVSENIQRTLANSGVAVKRNDVQFTPGVLNGVVSIDADILEIDTQNREVAFNGELLRARAKIDVLADFIYLAPGNNIIEFEDTGNPESQATCKIYYRSGWLS
jgi:hypothetical protein